ncbi:MAG: hypothetical protein LQ345_007035 [Seirophora villosa]|nr:MAG: hypothetical protein LQ345_007035 [Seirophora villosa]
MRLLNTSTLEFHDFFDRKIPEYAILSHRWGSDEVSFKDFEDGIQQSRGGFAKIRECCNLASEHCYTWVWIDTCFIDKKSSAELTEAINSMYSWYKKAALCYVYLADVLWENDTTDSHQASMNSFRASLWFTRGWTLQELLAPEHVRFFDQRWQCIGTKEAFVQEISRITRIGVQDLLTHSQRNMVEPCTKAPDCRAHCPKMSYWNAGRWGPSVATKMSWIFRRQTSRIEDLAYCLLGIFDVNMPLLYGEGQKAFMRLQYEILKQNGDESIFAWTTDSYGTGMLANWPTQFANSMYVHGEAPIRNHRRPYSMTNQGLTLPITWRA